MKDLTDAPGRYINKLAGKLEKNLDSFAAKYSISAAEGRTLEFILVNDRTLYQKDIEEEYGLNPATATELLQKMEKSGLIRREVDEEDARRKKILLTPHTLELKERLLEDMEQMEARLADGISPEQMEVFSQVIRKMLENVSWNRKPACPLPRHHQK